MTPSRRNFVPVRIFSSLAMVAAFGIALPATPSAAAAQPIPGPGEEVGPFAGAYGCTSGGTACFLIWQYVTPAAGVVDPPGLETYEMTFGLSGSGGHTFSVVDSWLLQFASGATRTVSLGAYAGTNGLLTDFQQIAGDLLVGSSVTYQLPGMESTATLVLTPYTYGVAPTVTPEPATVALLGGGLALLGVGGVARRRAATG